LNDELLKAEWTAANGEVEDALKQLDKQIERLPNEVLPIACKAWVQFKHGEADAAKKTFETLLQTASAADLQTPLLVRLSDLANQLSLGDNWAQPMEMPADFGQRPELDDLGPFRWRPYLAPDFKALSKDGETFTKDSVEGKPTILIFYLGFGCLHCVEQLHAFSPRLDEFKEAGIDIAAISTESVESLNKGLSAFGKTLEIPLHSDESLSSFKRYRCYDDFEQQPLHGTYLIDAKGRVLWQDISYEPFMDVDFALTEAKRQLNLHAK
jgi:peroxiredoxin